MITLLGLRQQQLLTLLLENKEGLTVEELSKGLGITDNAVRQHLTALERDGMVVKGETQSTGGRPEQLFGLTAAGRQVGTRLAGVKDRAERIRALSGIMRELGYQSGSVDPANEKLPAIEATNCVFHSLAQSYPEVCYFDLALMSEIVGRDAIHDECMVRGGNVCRFKFKERP